MRDNPSTMDKLLIVWFLLVLGLVYFNFASAQLRGPEGAVCTRQASRQVMYTVENRRKRDRSSGMWGYLGMWDVFGVKTARNPRSLQTVYAMEYFIDYECCVGWNRIEDTCQADCYSPCEHGLCVDTNVCVCDEGWEGQQCEHDVDECWYETDECDRENGACTNTEGSYNCTCNDGLHLINGTVCHEIPDTDECTTDSGGCDQNCHNTHGSYYCTCDAGYTLAADRHTCTDINECATNNGGCEHFCRNVPGGRACSCRNNHRLVDGHVCRDDDMYPYGEEAGETPRRWDFSTCTEESLPQEGFRFFGRRHHEIHICDNGIVSFDRINRPRNPVLIQNTFGFRKAAVLVPFLARSNASRAMATCQHCWQTPCVTTDIRSARSGQRPAHVLNHAKRHAEYRHFWRELKKRGFWTLPGYLQQKVARGCGRRDIREVMPDCVLTNVRSRYPNPPNIPYMGHKRH